MEGWQVAVIVLVSILVGALVPAVVLFFITLRTLKTQIESTGQRLDDTLDQLRKTIERVDRMSSNLEGSEQKMAHIVGEIDGFLHSVERLKNTALLAGQVATMVAPFVSNLVQQFRNSPSPASEEEENRPEA